MASDLNKKKRTAGRGSAVVNTPGVKPPATVPEDRVEILRHLPQKKGATIVPPPGGGSASSPEVAGGAYNAGGSYDTAGGDETKESVSAVSPEVPAREEAASFRAPEADRAAQLRYDSALAALERKQGEAPHYDSRYDEQIRQLYEQITGRRPFRYDSATDPLYQQYAQRYTEQGAQAMRDTMGRAAALTGGYGSSYAQSVGQQQFDAYLRRLADVLPQTYGMALDAYRAEGDELQRRYELAAGLEKSDYERYLDSLGQYNRDLALARADVGIAIGGGTDIAMETADVVLLRGDLRDVVTAVLITRRVLEELGHTVFIAAPDPGPEYREEGVYYFRAIKFRTYEGYFVPIFPSEKT